MTIKQILTATPVITTATPPVMGKINTYDATAGPLDVTLPPLSTTRVDASCIVEKSILDVTGNAVTFICNGADHFDDDGTTLALPDSGQMVELQVISRDGGATVTWKQMSTGGSGGGGMSGGSTTLTGSGGIP